MELIKFPSPDDRIAEVKEMVRDCLLNASDRLDELVEQGKLTGMDAENASNLDQKILALRSLLD